MKTSLGEENLCFFGTIPHTFRIQNGNGLSLFGFTPTLPQNMALAAVFATHEHRGDCRLARKKRSQHRISGNGACSYIFTNMKESFKKRKMFSSFDKLGVQAWASHYATSSQVLHRIRRMVFLAAQYNFTFSIEHTSVVDNCIAAHSLSFRFGDSDCSPGSKPSTRSCTSNNPTVTKNFLTPLIKLLNHTMKRLTSCRVSKRTRRAYDSASRVFY